MPFEAHHSTDPYYSTKFTDILLKQAETPNAFIYLPSTYLKGKHLILPQRAQKVEMLNQWLNVITLSQR